MRPVWEKELKLSSRFLASAAGVDSSVIYLESLVEKRVLN